MKYSANFQKILILFCFFSSFFTDTSFLLKAEESLEIIPNRILKQGNFLIGIKQYIGSSNNNSSETNKITFKTDNNFVRLNSSNGVKHKSKVINIIWKKVLLKKPYSVERLVIGPFSSYESAQKVSINLRKEGYQAVVAYPNNWEVWIPFDSKLSKKKYTKVFKKTFQYEITPFLINDFSQQKLEGPISISSPENIKINQNNYGRNFYLVKDSYGTWTLIQKIKYENYLAGVLPHEIGANSPLEALKAQAVIARTWAIYNSDRFSIDKYHLCITTQCQVYKPPKVQNKNIQKAIKDTSDLIITYQDKPINSFYHASNGGISASSSESWKMDDFSYFNPMIDGVKSLKNNYKIPIKNKIELSKFLDNANEKIYGNNHRLFRWKKKISSEAIQNLLITKKLLHKQDELFELKIIERGPSGRVTKLAIQQNTFKKKVILEKDDIRRILGFLPSNLFIINKLNDNFWLFKGGGFGHGVGLSQSGAIEMAELGFNYEQILKHYYQGTKIKKLRILYQLSNQQK